MASEMTCGTCRHYLRQPEDASFEGLCQIKRDRYEGVFCTGPPPFLMTAQDACDIPGSYAPAETSDKA